MQVSLILWIHTNVCWRCTRKSAPFLNAFIKYEPKKKSASSSPESPHPRAPLNIISLKNESSPSRIVKALTSPHLRSFGSVQGRQKQCCSCFSIGSSLFFFFPINTRRRRLSRRLVISHTAAGVSCLLDKTLLILSCQKLWISQKGTITDTGMHLWCLMEKVTAIIWRCNSLNFEELQVPGCCVSKWILCLKSFSTSTHLFSLISPWL